MDSGYYEYLTNSAKNDPERTSTTKRPYWRF